MPIMGPPTARESGIRSGMAGFFSGTYAYAWFLLTEEEKEAYAAWHESGASGEYNVVYGELAMPRNWKLLEEGSVAGVADVDVGIGGLHYLAKAGAVMKGGLTEQSINEWRRRLRAQGKWHDPT